MNWPHDYTAHTNRPTTTQAALHRLRRAMYKAWCTKRHVTRTVSGTGAGGGTGAGIT